ncbi:hypothetical protein MPSEU_000619200 [Mayamaea pseudoterrestris]|nr:hypothetical protein MPSEU_000619200 [Mayamaea pseudoterrestris]
MLAHMQKVANKSRRRDFYAVASWIVFGMVCGLCTSHLIMTGLPQFTSSDEHMAPRSVTAVLEYRRNHDAKYNNLNVQQQQEPPTRLRSASQTKKQPPQPNNKLDDRLLSFNNTTNMTAALEEQLLKHPGQRTYTQECRSSFLFNNTWGKLKAQWADKDHVKRLIHDLNIPHLKIPKTLALFNKTVMENLTVQDLQLQIESLNATDYIIKPTHTSGAVAKVLDGSHYSCFKKCKEPADEMILPEALPTVLENMKYSMEHFFSNPRYEAFQKGRQTQYQYIPRQIIMEEHLNMDTLREWHWWVIDGHPLWVCRRCGLNGTYYSSRFQPLQLSLGHYPACGDPPAQPKTWSKMMEIVSRLSKHVTGIMRLDLYADDESVYFSEITFTTSSCDQELNPTRADALVYAVAHGTVSHELATPEFVERVVNDGVVELPQLATAGKEDQVAKTE